MISSCKALRGVAQQSTECRTSVDGACRSAFWRLLPVPVLAVTVWAAAISPSGATGSGIVADWQMNEPAGASVLVDSGPNGLHGRIGSSVQAGVIDGPSVVHRFSLVAPDTSPLDPERLDLVAHDDRLNPGDDDVALTVRLRTTSPQGNVVQKGQALSTGGYVKLDMDDGRIACLFKGSEGAVHVRSAVSIADGVWHEVRCVRTRDEVVLSIDGLLADRRRSASGVVANTWPFAIAGKSSCNQGSVGCDYFSGDIDRVLLERTSVLVVPTTAPPTTVAGTSTTAAPTTVATTTAPPTTAPPTTRATTTTRVPVTTTTTTAPPVVK